MENCTLCKLMKEELPAYKLYEDDLIKVILPKSMETEGHLLLVSKEHYENVFETPDKVLERMTVVCKKMSLMLKEKLGITGVNILNASGKDAQQSVQHLHFHIVSRRKDDGLDMWLHNHRPTEINIEEAYKKLK